MKKALLAVLLFAGLIAPARAGIYYQLTNNASSDTLRVGYAGADRNDSVFVASGTLTAQSTSATAGYIVTQALNYAGSQILKLTQSGALTVSSFIGNLTGNVTGNVVGNVTGNLTGNADTATTIAVLPAISGAALTSLTPGNISDGALRVGVTLSTGNVVPGFNAANNFVRLDGTGKMPAVDGAALTNVTGTATPVPSRQILLSGSGATYTTPANARQLHIRMVGAGGGGASSAGNAGGSGGYTTFDVTSAAGGFPGTLYGYVGGALGGTGGAGGVGIFTSSSVYRVTGGVSGGGCGGYCTISNGGSSQLGAGGPSPANGMPGIAALANSGGGGSGGINSGNSGVGGSGGEYVELWINSPAGTYTYSIGAAGAAGFGSGLGGAAGGTGVIIVDESY